MNDRDFISSEDWERIERLVNGQCSDEDVRALEQTLQGNPAAQKLMLDYCQLHLDLSLEVGSEKASRAILDRVAQSSQQMSAALPPLADNSGLAGESPTMLSFGMIEPSKSLFTLGGWLNLPQSVLLLAIGGLLVMVGGISGWMLRDREQADPIAAAQLQPVTTPVAYLTAANGCNWAGEQLDSWEIGRGIQLGDEIALHEGIAEFRLASGVSLSIEGPATLLLNSPTSLVVQYGKFTIHVPWTVTNFNLTAAACRISASEAEFGVNVTGDKADIHVFSGQVVAAPMLEDWNQTEQIAEDIIKSEEELPGGEEFSRTLVHAGRGLALESRSAVTRVVEWHPAARNEFAVNLPMAGSLPITPAYVQAVLASKPIDYWRFEQSTDDVVPNEIAGGMNLRAVGKLHLAGDAANRVAEFGRPGSTSYLLSENTLNTEGKPDYSVEFWLKPSHIHEGACITMLVDSSIGKKELAALYMQFCGAVQRRIPAYNRSRFRFLHRNPPGPNPLTGTSCYSREPYAPRRWQHIVAVKEGATMQLYIDGTLASTETDKSPLPADLRLVIGQLGVEKRLCPFIGQMDELAIYDRALSSTEVERHWKAVKFDQQPNYGAGPDI